MKDIRELNEKYIPLTPVERIRELYNDFNSVLFTSSFGATSALLLHLFSKARPQQIVHFIDTTYHFVETLEYKDLLIRQLELNVVDLTPEKWKNEFTKTDQTWKKDPDFCCSINKVEPVERIKKDYQVWVSGLMAHQNGHRQNLNIFEQKDGNIRFYPIIDLTAGEVAEIYAVNNLPRHPLQAMGYNSIGCMHCTRKGEGRGGRWANFAKTECGLHL